MTGQKGPLDGVTVLELGGYIAGPFCTRLLGDMGARVIKVEPPQRGDPLREWGHVHTPEGSLWWFVQGRNKESVLADLHTPEGRELVRRLVRHVDVVVENFTPGRLEEWDLGPDCLRGEREDLIIVRISGFGQTGPYRNRPTFGTTAEAMAGLRYLTGEPDGPPMRVGLSLADSIAAIYGAMSTCAALRRRQVEGVGDVIDVALTEAVFSLLESVLPEYGFAGMVRQRMGNRLNGAAPSNSFLTRDGQWIAIGGNGERIFTRLAQAMGRPELAADPRFRTNRARRENVDELEQLIADWAASRDLDEVWELLNNAGVPAGPIYSIQQIVADPQFQARGMIQSVDVPGIGTVLMPAPVPVFESGSGEVRRPGPRLGADHDRIVAEFGLNESLAKVAAATSDEARFGAANTHPDAHGRRGNGTVCP